jgi:hypothetical protein
VSNQGDEQVERFAGQRERVPVAKQPTLGGHQHEVAKAENHLLVGTHGAV